MTSNPVQANARLMALFPHLFSRRGRTSNVVDSRQWRTLDLAADRVRVLGPNWSFVFLLRDQNGMARNFAMDVLQERAQAEDSARGARNLHQPTVAKFDVADIWHSNLTGKAGRASRYSLIAADVGTDLPLGTDANLQAVNTDRSTALIGRAFGVFPLNRDFRNDQHNDTGSLYLTAFQAVEGEIWFKPREAYLAKLRAAFGLSAPGGGIAEADHIVLLPDGFALCGAIASPLRQGALSAWFKVTHRGGLPDGPPIMRLWETSQIRPSADWRGLLADISGRIAEAGQDVTGGGPGWLRVATTAALTEQALFWPCRRSRSILLSRDASSAISIDGGLSVRLSAGPRNALSIEPEAFTLDSDNPDDALTLKVTTGNGGYAPDQNPFGAAVAAHYHFERGADQGGENVRLSGGSDPNEDAAMTLSVPLLSNAARLREALDFDEPPAKDDRKGGGRLWLYTPLSDGWLHWPFPNATARLMFKLLPKSESQDKSASDLVPQHSLPARTAGMLRFAPRMGGRERDWSLSLSDARAIDLTVALRRLPVPPADAAAGAEQERWMVAAADCTFLDLSVGMQGLLPVTAFAQTETALLPDTAARALRQTALTALTPDLLNGTEAEVWHTIDPKSTKRLRVSAVLQPITVTRRKGGDNEDRAVLDPDVELTLDVQWPWEEDTPLENVPFGAPPGTSQPWLWARHRSVPTLQTMPLTTAGALTNAPSSTRELTPLRLERAEGDLHGADHKYVYAFKEVFRTEAGHVHFEAGATSGGARPDAKVPWDSEIGMAVATLPTVTLFPGDATSRSTTLANAGWPGLSGEGLNVQAELRYDISLTDEGAALATLPPPPKNEEPLGDGGDADPAEPEVQPPQTFTVLGYNAPGKEGVPGGTSWMPVWASRARAKALTATAHRRMVEGDRLKSLVLDQQYQTTVGLALTPFTTENTLDIVLSHIGALTLGGEVDQSFEGLPATTDLTGITGTFSRNGAEIAVTRGTLEASGSINAPMRDQAGLTQRPESQVAVRTGLHLKTWTQQDGATATSTRTGTLTAPLSVPGSAAWPARLFLRDVPFEKNAGGTVWEADLKAAWFDEATGFDGAASGLDPQKSQKHAFGWAFDQQDAPQGHIALGPFLFEPLALVSASLAEDQTAPPELDRVAFRGRIKIALPALQRQEPALIAAPENVTLAYHGLSGETPHWHLTAETLTLPLEDALASAPEDDPDMPKGPAGPAPVLKLKGFKLDSLNNLEMTSAKLLLHAGNQPVALPLPTAELQQDALWFGTADAAEEAEPEAAGNLRLRAAAVTLPLLRRAQAPQEPSATAQLSAQFGSAEDAVTLTAEMTIDARTRAPVSKEAPVTAKLGELQIPLTAKNVALSRDTLHFDLTARTGNDKPFGGMTVVPAETRGAVLALLVADTNDESGSSFDFGPWSFALKLALSEGASNLALAFDRQTDALNVVVSGQMKLPNAIQAPSLQISTDADGNQTATLDGDRPALQHEIAADFDGVRVAVQSLSGQAINLPARVRHSISRPQSDLSLDWTAHQLVTLWDAHHFPRARGSVEGSSHSPVSLRPARSGGVDGQVSRHVAQSRDVMVCGLSASQWDALKSAFPETGTATLLDFGAHHFIGAEPSEALHHLPLPGIGTPGSGSYATLQAVLAPTSLDNRQLRRAARPALPGLAAQRRRDLEGMLDAARGVAGQGWTDLAGALIPSDADRPDHLMSRRERALENDAVKHPIKPDEKPTSRWRRPHRSVFHGQTEVSITADDWSFADPDLPWADTALSREALLDELSMAVDKQEAPVALTLMPLAWADSALVAGDLVSRNRATGRYDSILTDVTFQRGWQRVGPAFQAFVPGPDFNRGATPDNQGNAGTEGAVELRILVPDRNRGRITEVARKVVAEIGLHEDKAKLTKWARSTIARLAPWSLGGLLLTARKGPGAAALTSALYVVNPRAPSPVVPLRFSGRRGPVKTHPQHMAATPDTPISEGLRDGALPIASGATVLQSEPGTLPAEGQTEVRLTASSGEMAFALARSTSRFVAENARTDFWISDRNTVAFRGFENVETTDDRARLSFAPAPGSTQPPPAALLPSSTGGFQPPPPPDLPGSDSARAMLPAQMQTRMVNARSGIMAQHRIGVQEGRQGGFATPIDTPHGALRLRTPRPVELGRNDQPRASAYEDAHLALSKDPQALIHGPAKALDQRSLSELGGLNREPRSKFATLLRLSHPAHGILPPDWRGDLQLTVAANFGEVPEEGREWKLTGAYLDIGGVLFQPEGLDKLTLDLELTLSGFVGPEDELATTALARLPAAAPVTLTLLLRTGELERLTVMHLRRGGMGQPLVDTPVFFRFDDPSYNDMLSGLPRLNRRPLPGSNCDLVIVADRKEVQPQDFVATALFIEPREPGDTPDRKFLSAGGVVSGIGDADGALVGTLNPSLTRRRIGLGTPHEITKDLTFRADPSDPQVATLNLTLFAYELPDDVPAPLLQEKDQMTLGAQLGDDGLVLPLTFDVTNSPRHPANPSGYAVLRHDSWPDPEAEPEVPTRKQAISAPLYARGPVPTIIELVDPKEMLSGIVRRRAIYAWSSFAQSPPSTGDTPRFALLKSSANGAAWLENRVSEAWPAIVEPEPDSSDTLPPSEEGP